MGTGNSSKKMMHGGNYEIQMEHARQLFLQYDQEKIQRKLPLPADETFLYLDMLDQQYRINRETGYVEMAEQSGGDGLQPVWTLCRNFEAVMTIYDVLCYSREGMYLSGQMCPVESLQVAGVPSPGTFYRSYALYFTGKSEALYRACLKIGGIRQEVPASADVCCQIPVFSFFPAVFQFWDADDEFPAAMKILWDSNALDYLHFETIYYVMKLIVDRLKQHMQEEER